MGRLFASVWDEDSSQDTAVGCVFGDRSCSNAQALSDQYDPAVASSKFQKLCTHLSQMYVCVYISTANRQQLRLGANETRLHTVAAGRRRRQKPYQLAVIVIIVVVVLKYCLMAVLDVKLFS